MRASVCVYVWGWADGSGQTMRWLECVVLPADLRRYTHHQSFEGFPVVFAIPILH